MSVRARQRLAAYALITDKAGRVLLTKHPDERRYRGRWVLPGGGVEYGEHPEQALIREIREETGLSAKAGEIVAVLSDITTPGLRRGMRRRRLHNIRLVYVATVTGRGADAGADDEHLPVAGARWCSRQEWQELPLAPFTARVLGTESGSGLPAAATRMAGPGPAGGPGR